MTGELGLGGSWPSCCLLGSFAGFLWQLPVVARGFGIVPFPLSIFSSMNHVKFLSKQQTNREILKPSALA